MPRNALLVATILLLSATNAVAQARPGWRWSVAAGPSLTFGQGRAIFVGLEDEFTASPDDTMIVSEVSGKYHVALGLARELGGSALVARTEVFYNRGTGSSRSPLLSYGLTTRSQLREDVFGLNLGFQWEALPSRRFSPYLLTTAGVMHSRIGWNRNGDSNHADETATSWGATAAIGTGVRLRLGTSELFSETRRYYRFETLRGSTFIPLSIGIRF